jgi:uncharacterized protein (TIGR02145 family)
LLLNLIGSTINQIITTMKKILIASLLIVSFLLGRVSTVVFSGIGEILQLFMKRGITDGAGITDVDGNTYRTKVYNGVEWMIDNSKKTTGVTGCTYGSIDRGDDGRLYSWNCAANACPDGWSLPTDADFSDLKTALNAKGASAWDDWNSGSALAGGGNHGSYGGNQGSYGYWWSSSSSNRGWSVSSGDTSGSFYTYYSGYSLSVRCRKSQ